jgi:hypothetical protein
MESEEGRNEAPTPVQFKRGRSSKRRQRQALSDDEEGLHTIKTAKAQLKGAIKVSSGKPSAGGVADDAFKGTGEIQQDGDMGATRILEEDTERGLDRRSQKEASMRAELTDDGKYHGMAGYKDWRGVRTLLHVLMSCISIGNYTLQSRPDSAAALWSERHVWSPYSCRHKHVSSVTM